MFPQSLLDRWTGRPDGVLVVLGSANVDLVMRQPRLAQPGETIAGHRFEPVPGGKGLNQAVAAARAGGRVAFLGRVGNDDMGRQLADFLRSEGVDVNGLVVEPRCPTGVAQVSVLDGGENAIVVAAGANASTHWSGRDEKLVTTAAAVIAQQERPEKLVRAAFEVARAHGVLTVLTPAPVSSGAHSLLPLVDILRLNEHEATELAGHSDATDAAQRLSRDQRLVVMTRGPASSIVAHNGAVVHREPARQASVVDTTGAGDCFAGTLVARLAAGDPPTSAIRSATVAASLSVGREGAAVAMPLWSEVQEAADY